MVRSLDITAEELTHLAGLLGIEDRCVLVGHMWDVALSDKELHAAEEALISSLSDRAGVPRKRVIEQQARAAARQ